MNLIRVSRVLNQECLHLEKKSSFMIMTKMAHLGKSRTTMLRYLQRI